MLSREARYRLNRSAQSLGYLSILLIPITASFLKDSQGWVVVPVALAVSGLGLFVLAYFTVMGFGKVELSFQLAPAGLPNSSDEKGGLTSASPSHKKAEKGG
jgi:hypothetical protein